MVEKIKQALVDAKLGKYFSRKLLVWLVTTLFFVLGMVTSEQWLMIAVAYVGTEGFIDAVSRWRNK